MATINQYKPQTVSHPGATLEEILEELRMGPKEFSVRSGKPEKTITAVLKGDSAITPEMAVRFENVLKIPARFWLERQYQYDEYLAREKANDTIQTAIEWSKSFPINPMKKLGWIHNVTTKEEKVKALLDFFGVSSHEAWERYYLKSELKVQFRISLAHTNEPEAISAWLRRGEILASQLEAPPYSEKKFKEILPKIKVLMSNHPKNFLDELQTLSLEAGIKLVYTPCLPKAPINGATRWLNDHPIIQLSCRYKRNDIFWFNYFHELGHILLHGKKDVFLEKVEYSEKDQQKEREADEFAIKWTLSKEEEEEILAAVPLTESDIVEFAKKFTTHPAIIIGRFQHQKLISYTEGRRFFEPVEFKDK